MTGTEIRVNGGAVASVQEIGCPEGTSIEVADLFYNLPARRKFLKSDTAEATQCSRVVTQFSLGYPEVGFTLTSGNRTLLQWPPVAGLDARLYQIFGDRPDLVPVEGRCRVARSRAMSRHSPTRVRRGGRSTCSSTGGS